MISNRQKTKGVEFETFKGEVFANHFIIHGNATIVVNDKVCSHEQQ